MTRIIDLRSDTATRPTPEMRAAMAAAEVGDDVLNDDPTINRLQERVAALLGKEAAPYVPSGTMSNQICVKVHTQPGDEILCEAACHIYTWEAGGPAVLSGVTCRTVEGDYGILDVDSTRGQDPPDQRSLCPHQLVCLENTHNRGGGRVYPLTKLKAIHTWARANGLCHASRRRQTVECQRGFRYSSQGVGAPISTAYRSVSARGSARRLGQPWQAPRISLRGPRGSANSSGAVCGKVESSPREHFTPSIITSTGWPMTTTTHRSLPTRFKIPRPAFGTRGG